MLAQAVYIAYTPLAKKWCLCTRRLAYILHESWLFGVFRAYTWNTPRNHDLYITYTLWQTVMFNAAHNNCYNTATTIASNTAHDTISVCSKPKLQEI